MTYILGISASPKRGGIAERLLTSALDGAGQAGPAVEKIILNELNFKPCQQCGGCDDTGLCSICDDMRLVYKKFDEADGFIIASPIFFGSVSAQLKAMVDRFHCRWIRKYILELPSLYKKRRKGIFLCAAGRDKTEYFECARRVVKMLFGTLDIDYTGELFCKGYDVMSKDHAAVQSMLDKAFELGANLAKELSS